MNDTQAGYKLDMERYRLQIIRYAELMKKD